MNSMISRPAFFEGQLLAAADLSHIVDYARGQSERHNRFLHRWGIVNGLELTTEDAEDAAGNAYKRVFLGPGAAIDGNGREILVTERQELDAGRFVQTQGSNVDETAFYPVFLSSEYRAQAAESQAMGMCQTMQGTRVAEGFDISFGRLGDEVGLDEQKPSELSNAPSRGEGGSQFLILLGFVQWNNAARQFSDAVGTANGISRRYAGVNASTLAGHDGSVTVQTHDTPAVGQPVLQVSDEDGGELRFGLYKGPGPLEALLGHELAISPYLDPGRAVGDDRELQRLGRLERQRRWLGDGNGLRDQRDTG